MMSSVRRALPGLLVSLCVANATGQVPEFVDGDLDALEVQIARPKKSEDGMLVLEVKNGGAVAAEPVEFLIEPKPGVRKQEQQDRYELVRVGVPAFGRAGRAIAPGAKQRYWFPAPYGLEQKGARVRVTSASFFRGAVASKPPVVLGKLRREQRRDDATGRSYRCALFAMENKADAPVDVLMLASGGSLRQPFLLMERLAALETREVGDGASGGSYVGRPGTYSLVQGDFDKVEIIDWSVVWPTDAQRARELLLAAWNNDYRWEAPDLPVHGRFRYQVDALTTNRGVPDGSGEGTFRVRATDSMLVEIDRDDAALRGFVSEQVGRAFAGLRRPAPETLLADHQVRIVRLSAPLRLQLMHVADGNCRRCLDPFVDIADGHIVGGRGSLVEPYSETRRTLIAAADGRMLEAGLTQVVTLRGTESIRGVQQTTYVEVGGVVMPRTFESQAFSLSGNSLEITARLTFDAIEIDRSAEAAAIANGPPPPPAGPAAAELRALWEGAYRYPATPVTLRGRVVVDAPNSRFDWQMRTRVAARFELAGYSGRRSVSDSTVCERATYEVEGVDKPETRNAIADLLRARYSIFARQDVCGRPSFEEQFAGATIARGGAGDTFVLERCAIREIEFQRGLIKRMAQDDGTVLRVRYAEVDGHPVPVETRMKFADRESIITAKFARIDAERVFPVEVEIRDWFTPGVGPETYRYEIDR